MSTEEEKKPHSQSETGHEVVAANLRKENVAIASIGVLYNPSASDISAAALLTKESEVDLVMIDWHTKQATQKESVNHRQFLYELVPSFCVRIMAEIEGLGADTKIIADARTIVRRIRGERAKAIDKTPVAKAPDAENDTVNKVKHSVSQVGFDNRLGNFTQLVKLLYVIPSFTPNEPDMTVASHEAFIVSLKNANKQVAIDSKSLAKVRLLRDKVLYDEKTGVVTLANRAKKYIKGAFGADSPEYALVKDLHFRTR